MFHFENYVKRATSRKMDRLPIFRIRHVTRNVTLQGELTLEHVQNPELQFF